MINSTRAKILYFISKKIDYPLVPPRNVTLTLNYTCNQRCIMCDIRRHPFNKDYEITYEEIKTIVDDMVKMKIPDLVITGGEPFLYNDIFKVITYAKAQGRQVIMITNGYYDLNLVEKVINSSVDFLQVSLDGSSAPTYDSIRGVDGAFDVVIANIKRFVEAKKPVGATATIIRQNYKDLINIALLAEELGCTKLALRPAHISNADPLNRDSENVDFWIPQTEIEQLKVVAKDLNKFNEQTGFLDFCPGVDFLPLYFRDGYLSSLKSCFIGFTRLIISYNERRSYGVWMCRDMIGDIRKHSIINIWYGNKARKMRKVIRGCKKICLFPEMHEPELDNLKTLLSNIGEAGKS